MKQRAAVLEQRKNAHELLEEKARERLDHQDVEAAGAERANAIQQGAEPATAS